MAYILSSQGVRIEQTAASFAARLAAFIIDWFLIFAIYFILVQMAIANMLDFINEYAIGTVIFLVPLLYPLLCEMFWNGQTLGKRWLHIRVISIDGGGPKITSLILRWLMLPFDVFLAMGVGELCVFFTKKQQRLGDLVAGTWVVKTEEFKRLGLWGEI